MSRKFQLLIFAAGTAAFAYLVAHAGVRGLLESLAEARWALPPIVAVWGVVYMLNTYSWRELMRITRVDAPDSGNGGRSGGRPSNGVPGDGIPSDGSAVRRGDDRVYDQLADAHDEATIPFWRAYVISVASFAINYVTPLVNLGGEPFRIAAAAPYVGTSRAAASVVSFRLAHTIGQLLFWLTAIPLAYLLLPHTWAVIAALALIAAVVASVVIALLGLSRRHVAERVLNALIRVPLTRRFAPKLEAARPVVARVDAELAALSGPGRSHFHRALAAEFLGRAVAMLEYFFIARAIGLHVSYLTAFVMGAFSQFVLNILFFIPFEMGTKEGGLYLIFRLLSLPPRLGVYAAIVSRLRELAWIAIGLCFVWLSRGGRPDYVLRYKHGDPIATPGPSPSHHAEA